MTHGIFGFFSGLGKGLGPSFGNKNGVVPEAAVTMRFGGYRAFDDAVEDVLVTVEYEHDDRAETCRTALDGDISQVVQQQSHIGSRVMPRTGSISGTVHAGDSA